MNLFQIDDLVKAADIDRLTIVKKAFFTASISKQAFFTASISKQTLTFFFTEKDSAEVKLEAFVNLKSWQEESCRYAARE